MKTPWMLALAAALTLPLGAQQPLPPALQKLDISTGHWVFHGTSRNLRTGKTGNWTWNEHCRWSTNREFLECSFSNVWSGKPIESLVVDTYNPKDHSYWHYEIFTSNSEHPFISKMAIAGNVWTEYGPPSAGGGPPHERILYVWSSPARVSVKIESSRDGTRWTTVDQGTGVKQR